MALVLLVLPWRVPGTTAEGGEIDTVSHHPDSLVAALYRAVTFSPRSEPDWGYVRSMFHPGALITLRVKRDSTAVLTVDGFIRDFQEFIERADARSTGFRERILRMKPVVFGNVAHAFVVYEASIPGSHRPPQQGVDSFHLVRQHGRWWITAIVNEVSTPDRPLPAELQE
jgi:hypothetical protein